MKRHALIGLLLLLIFGRPPGSTTAALAQVPSGTASGPSTRKPSSLVEARRGFKSQLRARQNAAEDVPEPPAKVFRLVRFDSPAGKLAAYVTPDRGDGQRRPAIIWITGGDCNSIGELWEDQDRSNDQTAAAYRKAGIVMMFPSLRGGNRNPGRREGFLGEVDDVLAAEKYLRGLSYVDPDRIYLGGHSTGGTLAMLVAESTDKFRAVFSFGPADDVSGYGPEYLPFDTSKPREIELRSPGKWLDSVGCPLYVLEGNRSPGNLASLRNMARASTNPLNHFVPVRGVNHFSILAPINEVIARKILKDQGPKTNIAFTEADLNINR